MYRRLVLILLTAVLALGTTAPAHAAPDPTTLQTLLTAEHTAGMPGLYAKVRDGRDTWAGAAGVAFVGKDVPPSPAFRHRVGSVTKTFVATVVLQLVGQRKVRLDAPAHRYLPGLGVPPQVTVQMLLNHTSGIGNYTDVLLRLDDPEQLEDAIVRMGRTIYRPEELARIGLGMPRTGAPGAAWSYSNTNYILLGLLIRNVTGKSFRTEITHRILRPLGLRDTYFPGLDPYIRGPHGGAYVPWSAGTLRDFSVYNMSWGEAAGEMISTVADLNRFYRALLTGRLLPPRLLAEMKTTVEVNPAAPGQNGYGLGLLWTRLPCGARVWGHTGGVIGQTTVSFHSEDGARQVSLGENMTFYPPGPIDLARVAFLSEALCDPSTAATADETAAAADETAAALLSGTLTADVAPRAVARR